MRVQKGLGRTKRVWDGPVGFTRVWISGRVRDGLEESMRIRNGPEGYGRV